MSARLWEVAKILLPPARVRPQGGGVANINDELLFAAITYVLVSNCPWRSVPKCFEVSKSTVHRRFTIWYRAGLWTCLYHEAVKCRLEQDVVDLARTLLDSARIRATKSGKSCKWNESGGHWLLRNCTSCQEWERYQSASPSAPSISIAHGDPMSRCPFAPLV
ncbi:transposase [Streptomyces sp. NPDC048489]|uniref:transposase n=1 Tax=Streptomyces sp. NPDC048489 TaxID=3154504 RepID=UPI00342BE47D